MTQKIGHHLWMIPYLNLIYQLSWFFIFFKKIFFDKVVLFRSSCKYLKFWKRPENSFAGSINEERSGGTVERPLIILCTLNVIKQVGLEEFSLHKMKMAQLSWQFGFFVDSLQFLHFVLPLINNTFSVFCTSWDFWMECQRQNWNLWIL